MDKIIEEIKVKYEVVLERYKIIIKVFDEENTFVLDDGTIVYSNEWYDLEWDN